jgi:hypothetical protein
MNATKDHRPYGNSRIQTALKSTATAIPRIVWNVTAADLLDIVE